MPVVERNNNEKSHRKPVLLPISVIENKMKGLALFLGRRLFLGTSVQFVGRQFERRILDLFPNGAGANALGAGPHGLGRAVFRGCPDILKIRQEGTTCDPGDFRTDPAEILRFTSRFNMVTDPSPFSANFTDASHCSKSFVYPGTRSQNVFRLENRFLKFNNISLLCSTKPIDSANRFDTPDSDIT